MRGQGHSVVRSGAAHAHRLLRTVAQPNVGEFVDALHWSRAAATIDEVSALPREWIHYMQICDGRLPGLATHEDLIHDARCERLLPGEVPNDKRAPAMGYEALALAWAAVAAVRWVSGDEGG